MTAPLIFRRAVTDYLNTRQVESLGRFTEAEWQKNLWWLDRSGLALPLAASLESLDVNTGVPPRAADALQLRLSDNELRMKSMLERFRETNDALASAGVRYCCVKGFSLIPDLYSDIRERHQVDLDFLIAAKDTARAKTAIESLGYRLLDERPSGELRFMKPTTTHLGIHAWLYQHPDCLAVEFHTEIWEPEADAIEFQPLSGFLDDLDLREVHGVRFPCLKPAYQFLYLALHLFRHLAGSWARLLSFYEVSLMIRQHGTESSPWEQVIKVIEKDEALMSACALVLGLTSRIFMVELPQPLQDLSSKHLSLESALWLESYADTWLFSDPPGNKLPLLVQEQFCHDPQIWQKYIRRRLFPVHRAPSLSENAGTALTKKLSYRTEDLLYKGTRIWYHIRSDVDFLQARVRWERLRRARRSTARPVASEV